MKNGFLSTEGKMILKLAPMLKQHDDTKHTGFIHYYKGVKDSDGKIKMKLYNIEEVDGYGFCRLYNSTASFDSLRWREYMPNGKLKPLDNPRRYECADLSPEGILKELDIIHKKRSYYMACSGGKDSISLTHFVHTKYRDYFKAIFYVKTKVGLKMVQEWLEGYAEGMGWQIHVIGNDTDVYRERALINGFPIQANHPIIMRRLKYIPMYDFCVKLYNEGIKDSCLIFGTRKFESVKRMGNVPPILKHGKLWSCSPFYSKTTEWVLQYVADNKLILSPAHTKFGKSGDCFCSCYPKVGDMELIKKYDRALYDYFMKLQKDIEEHGTEAAKKYGTWGHTKGSKKASKFDEMEGVICGEDCGAGTLRGDDDF